MKEMPYYCELGDFDLASQGLKAVHTIEQPPCDEQILSQPGII